MTTTQTPASPRSRRMCAVITGAMLAIVAALLVVVLGGCSSASPASSSPAPSRPATSAPAHQTPTAEQIAKAMHVPGPVFAYTAKTDPNNLLGRDGEYTSKVNWGGPTSDASNNSIEVFGSPADAAARMAYLAGFKPPFGDGYDHQTGNAVLRLSSDYTPDQAHALQAAFDRAVAA